MSNTYWGRMRLFVHKIERKHSYQDGYEIMASEHFDDGLISDVKPGSSKKILTCEIENGHDLWNESIERILRRYKMWDVVEIVADAHVEYSSSFNGETTEHDAQGWFRRIKHRKLNAEQIREFCHDHLAEQRAEEAEWEKQQNQAAYA